MSRWLLQAAIGWVSVLPVAMVHLLCVETVGFRIPGWVLLSPCLRARTDVSGLQLFKGVCTVKIVVSSPAPVSLLDVRWVLVPFVRWVVVLAAVAVRPSVLKGKMVAELDQSGTTSSVGTRGSIVTWGRPFSYCESL